MAILVLFAVQVLMIITLVFISGLLYSEMKRLRRSVDKMSPPRYYQKPKRQSDRLRCLLEDTHPLRPIGDDE